MRVLIVDDHEVVRRGLRSLLGRERGVQVCGEAVDGSDAILKARELKPDAITMDITMPSINGLEATRAIRRFLPEVLILILSQHDGAETMRQALDAGANGYVVKSEVSTHLVTALGKVRHGGLYFDHKLNRGETSTTTRKSPAPNGAATTDWRERRQTSQESAEQKARLLDLSSEAILVRDAEDRITFWNAGATGMYGHKSDQTLGRISHELLRTEFSEPLEAIREKLQWDGHWSGELLHTCANGSTITVASRWVAELDAQRNITSVLEANVDINEIKRAQEAQSRLAAIVECSDDAIISKNLDGIIATWNKAAERIFGYSAAEAIGRHISLIIPPDRSLEEEDILARIRRNERIDHLETVRQRKDGTLIDISATISPVKDATGRTIGASKVARDITERKRLERVVREAELSGQLLQLQDDERRRVARELHDGAGQLLAAMKMNMSVIEQEKLSPKGARCVEENLALIDQAVAEIRTISYLLHPPLLDEVGLQSALSEYVQGFGERSNIRVSLELSGDLERLPRDVELSLFRIVQECLTNIHRHSGSATAQVRLQRMPGEVQLEVADQGRGIDPAIQENFFTGNHTGVGLRGMRERVRQIGGALEIESTAQGTSVQVVLPIQDQNSVVNDSTAIAETESRVSQ